MLIRTERKIAKINLKPKHNIGLKLQKREKNNSYEAHIAVVFLYNIFTVKIKYTFFDIDGKYC